MNTNITISYILYKVAFNLYIFKRRYCRVYFKSIDVQHTFLLIVLQTIKKFFIDFLSNRNTFKLQESRFLNLCDSKTTLHISIDIYIN
jgi:hypothetical protein